MVIVSTVWFDGNYPGGIYIINRTAVRSEGRTMSDRLKDLEVELRDVIVALKDVAGTQWYDLGLQLRLSPSTLDTIASDHQTADDCKRVMLRKWLQSDPEASWEKLAASLTLTGHKSTAAVIKRQFSLISISKDEDHTTEGDKIREYYRLSDQ